MPANLSPREALEEIRKAASHLYVRAAFHAQVQEILSRVSPEEEPQRGHARNCTCCNEFERPHAAQSSCKCPSCRCGQCDRLKITHPYRDLRCVEATEESVEELVSTVRELLRDDIDCLDYPKIDVYGRTAKQETTDGCDLSSFWSEVGLYGRVGKEAARTILGRYERARAVLARFGGKG